MFCKLWPVQIKRLRLHVSIIRVRSAHYAWLGVAAAYFKYDLILMKLRTDMVLLRI